MGKFSYDDYMNLKKKGLVSWDDDLIKGHSKNLNDFVKGTSSLTEESFDDNVSKLRELEDQHRYVQTYINSLEGSGSYNGAKRSFDSIDATLNKAKGFYGQFKDSKAYGEALKQQKEAQAAQAANAKKSGQRQEEAEQKQDTRSAQEYYDTEITSVQNKKDAAAKRMAKLDEIYRQNKYSTPEMQDEYAKLRKTVDEYDSEINSKKKIYNQKKQAEKDENDKINARENNKRYAQKYDGASLNSLIQAYIDSDSESEKDWIKEAIKSNKRVTDKDGNTTGFSSDEVKSAMNNLYERGKEEADRVNAAYEYDGYKDTRQETINHFQSKYGDAAYMLKKIYNQKKQAEKDENDKINALDNNKRYAQKYYGASLNSLIQAYIDSDSEREKDWIKEAIKRNKRVIDKEGNTTGFSSDEVESAMNNLYERGKEEADRVNAAYEYDGYEDTKQETINHFQSKYGDAAYMLENLLHGKRRSETKEKYTEEYKNAVNSKKYDNNSVTRVQERDTRDDLDNKKYMTDEEYSVYTYLLNNRREDDAEKFFNAIKPELNQRMTQAQAQKEYELGNEGFGGAVLASLKSLGYNVISGGGIIEDVVNYATHNEIDTNSMLHMPSHLGDTDREGVSDLIGEDNPVGQWIYGTLMSVADNAINLAISKGIGKIGGVVGNLGKLSAGAETVNRISSTAASVIMGSQVATQTVIDCKDKGMDDGTAIGLGFIHGLVEHITEKVSIESILSDPRTFKQALKKSFVSEGSEEVAANWLDRIADNLLLGDKSEEQQKYKELKAQGLSDTEAFTQVMLAAAGEDASAFFAGGISGVAMSGTSHAFNAGVKKLEERSANKSLSQTYQAIAKEASKSKDFDEKKKELIEQAKNSGDQKARSMAESFERTIERNGGKLDSIKVEDVGNMLQVLDDARQNAIESGNEAAAEQQSTVDSIIESSARTMERSKIANKSFNDIGLGAVKGKRVNLNAFGASHPKGIRVTQNSNPSISHDIVRIESSAKEYGEKENTVVLKTSDGRYINADEVTMPTKTYDTLIREAKNYDTNGARGLLANYEGYADYCKRSGKEADVKEYIQQYDALYDLGRHGVRAESMRTGGSARFNSIADAIGIEQAENALNTGANDADAVFMHENNVMLKMRMPGQKHAADSKVVIDVSEGEELNISDDQKNILQAIAQKTGRTIVLTDKLSENVSGTFAPDGKIYINSKIENSDYAVAVALHEAIHGLRTAAPMEYNALKKFIVNYLVEQGENIDDLLDDIALNWGKDAASEEARLEELAAQSVMALATDDAALKKAIECKENKKLLNKVLDAIKSIAEKVREFIKGTLKDGKITGAHNKQAQPWIEDVKALEKLAKLFSKYMDEQRVAVQETTQERNQGGVRYSVDKEFYNKFDAWDGVNPNITFVIGNTSEVLKSIGMKQQTIKMHSGMIISKLNKHSEMKRDYFRKIPELLEKPIIVQFSDAIDEKTGKQKYDSRITVLGELYAEKEGKRIPILVSLELMPEKKLKIRNFAIITSAYAKKQLQYYIEENSILYIDPNKKRTNNWLSRTGLQLPVGENQRGSVRRITYSDGKVKIQNPIHMTQMQEKLYKAGVIDDYGNMRKSVDDTIYDFKEKQNRIIQRSNPFDDDYHTWIRNAGDIKTFEETLSDSDYNEGEDFDPSYSWDMAQKALKSGKITVYSSYPISQGVFVTPSKMEAEDYAGGGRIFKKTVNLTDVAWIDPTQGQFAKVDGDENIKHNDLRFAVDDEITDDLFSFDGDLFEEDNTKYLDEYIKTSPQEAVLSMYNSLAKTGESVVRGFKGVKLDEGNYLKAARRLMKHYQIKQSLNPGIDSEIAQRIKEFVTEVNDNPNANYSEALNVLANDCKSFLLKSGDYDDTGKEIREQILGEIRGSTILLRPYEESQILESFGGMKNLKRAFFGKVNVGYERNKKKGGTYRYIEELVEHIREQLGKAYADESAEDSFEGWKWLDNMLNNVLQPKIINPYLDGEMSVVKSIDTAAAEMALDITNELITEKTTAAARMKSADKKVIAELRKKEKSAASAQKAMSRAKIEKFKTIAREEKRKRIELSEHYSDRLNDSERKRIEQNRRYREWINSVKDQNRSYRNLIFDETTTIRERYVEAREKVRYRKLLAKEYERMVKRLDGKANNNEYIPERLKAPILNLLELFEVVPEDGKNLPGYWAEYRNLKNVGQRIDDLLTQYQALGNEMSENYKTGDSYNADALAYDKAVEAALEEIKGLVKGKNVYGMSAEQLRLVYEGMKMLDTQLRRAVEVIVDGKRTYIKELAEKAVDEVQSVHFNKGSGIMDLRNAAIATHLDPVRYGRFLSGYNEDAVIYKLFKDLHEGDKKRVRIMHKAFTELQRTLNSEFSNKELKALQTEDVKDFDFRDKNTGDRVGISRAVLLSIYLTDRQADGHRQLVNEKANHYTRLPDLKLMNRDKMPVVGDTYSSLTKAKQKATGEKSHEVRFSKYDLEQIRDYVEGDSKLFKLAEAVSSVFNGVIKDEINEVSLQRYGKMIATVKDYFPIKSDPSYAGKRYEVEMGDSVRNWLLQSRGFTKQRVHAENALMIDDVLNVFLRHVQETAEYCGMMIPVENFKRVYGKGNDDVILSKALRDKFGSSANHYIAKLMDDIQAPKNTLDENFLTRLHGNYMGAVLMINPGSAIKQFAALPTAFKYFGISNVAKAPAVSLAKGKQLVEKYSKYTPYMWYRENGNGTIVAETSKQLGFTRKFSDWLDLMGKTDRFVVNSLLYAAEQHVKKTTELEFDSEEFNKEVARQFEQAIDESQPNNMVTSQPQFVRNKVLRMLSLNAFISQNMAMGNGIIDSGMELAARIHDNKVNKTADSKKAVRAAAVKFARHIIGVLLSGALLGLLNSLPILIIYHKWDDTKDEEGKTSLAKIAEKYVNDSLEAIAGAFAQGDYLYGTIKTLISGEGDVTKLEVMSLGTINDLAENVKKGDYWKAAALASDALGIPLPFGNNVQRLWRSAASYVTDLKEGNTLPVGLDDHTIVKNNGKLDTDNIGYYVADYVRSGNKEEAEKYINLWKGELMSQGKSEDKATQNIKNKLADVLAKTDDDVTDAFIAYSNGDYKKYDALYEKLHGYGFDQTDVEKAVNKVKNQIFAAMRDAGVEADEAKDDLVTQGFNEKAAGKLAEEYNKAPEEQPDDVLSDTGEGKKYKKADAFKAFASGDKEAYEDIKEYLVEKGKVEDGEKLDKDMQSMTYTGELIDSYLKALDAEYKDKSQKENREELKKQLLNIYGSWDKASAAIKKRQKQKQKK